MIISEKSIFKLTVFIPLISVILIAGILTYSIISYQHTFLDEEFIKEKDKYISSQKQLISNEVNKVVDLIVFKDGTINERVQKDIKNDSNSYYTIINSIYNNYKDTKSKKEIIDIIKSTLRDTRLTNENRYLNLFSLEGKAIMLPIQDHYEDLSILNFRDQHNSFYIQDSITIVKEYGKGYHSFYEVKPNVEQSKEFYKINYVQLFEPLDMILSVGVYLDTINKEIEKEILDRASQIRFGKKGYIYIVGENGKLLAHRDSKLIGVDTFKIKDINGKYYFKDGYNGAKQNNEIYLEYVSSSNKDSSSMYNAKKLSFAKYNDRYNWVISAGVYIDDLDKVLLAKKEENKKNFNRFTIYIIILAIVLSVIVIFISFGFAVKIKGAFRNYQNMVKNKENELYHINSSLEETIQQELNDSRKKDAQLLQQARFASLGEMIGNIAHQWRQPLSAISTISSGNIIQSQIGLLSDKDNTKSYEQILGHVSFLSQTIDDFRNYLNKSGDEIKKFDINDTILDVLKIIEITYKDNNITLIKNFSDTPLSCTGSTSELSQVILNILNNAKDILVEKNIENKIVQIETLKIEDNNIIRISDNGGGIANNIIEKIFDPYFTTKHQSQGTGIGLYMSKDIIHTKFNGFLSVENIDWQYKNKTLSGACFIIEI
ncbi:MAG: cache domain-containing protein [Campylobacterota bacterium]|nr:cache domain-containing protein [Campylobacterota bacterium]